jgi:GNAT superfamily N-acetyltransferase
LREVLIEDYPKEVIEALERFYTPEQIIDRSNHHLTLVCTLGSELVGSASLDEDRVRNVFVDVSRQRSGIGRELMGVIEERAREDGQKKLYLMAGISAVGFYEKLGYKTVRRHVRELGNTPIVEIQMDKTL